MLLHLFGQSLFPIPIYPQWRMRSILILDFRKVSSRPHNLCRPLIHLSLTYPNFGQFLNTILCYPISYPTSFPPVSYVSQWLSLKYKIRFLINGWTVNSAHRPKIPSPLNPSPHFPFPIPKMSTKSVIFNTHLSSHLICYTILFILFFISSIFVFLFYFIFLLWLILWTIYPFSFLRKEFLSCLYSNCLPFLHVLYPLLVSSFFKASRYVEKDNSKADKR